jgi:hypothetical protein
MGNYDAWVRTWKRPVAYFKVLYRHSPDEENHKTEMNFKPSNSGIPSTERYSHNKLRCLQYYRKPVECSVSWVQIRLSWTACISF